ncbi:trehalose-phosphatase [Pontibacter sp. JH31]|uniref:Trehalose 6-phosphate phosphatase n=1 Tax=Pontibacter aquaedesilientis TaxID=2766980 RepID=A0ABR7XCH2_9BACT|nr:trehalose-phosphatase [Pontibacter aquaedesilientis]MBD1396002.1 trehalose-phosphatase [Pontibacter aquaedesilientis]
MMIQKHEAHELPSALEKLHELKTQLQGKTPAVFLDYDGCLTPIVKRPEMAVLSDYMRAALQDLASVTKVAVVSGRDRQNVEQLVKLDNLYFAGSHGFDISGPDGMASEPGGAKAALPALDKAEIILQEKLRHVAGSQVERKRYAIAVHFRNVPDEQVENVRNAVNEVLDAMPALKIGHGKKIYELKPNLDWHKGKAVLWLMEELGLNDSQYIPLYIGDDITDEDAFAALQGHGIGILVGEHDDKTAATYQLESVEEVRVFLEDLTATIKKQNNG